MSEVEALALKLSKATRCAADLKSKFPQLSREVKAVSQGEVDNVIKQQEWVFWATYSKDKFEIIVWLSHALVEELQGACRLIVSLCGGNVSYDFHRKPELWTVWYFLMVFFVTFISW